MLLVVEAFVLAVVVAVIVVMVRLSPRRRMQRIDPGLAPQRPRPVRRASGHHPR